MMGKYNGIIKDIFKRHKGFEKNGVIVRYDACSDRDLEEVKRMYGNLMYVGSGSVVWVEGVKYQLPGEHHFFRFSDL